MDKKNKKQKLKYFSEDDAINSITIYLQDGDDKEEICTIVSNHDYLTSKDRNHADLILNALNKFDPY